MLPMLAIAELSPVTVAALVTFRTLFFTVAVWHPAQYVVYRARPVAMSPTTGGGGGGGGGAALRITMSAVTTGYVSVGWSAPHTHTHTPRVNEADDEIRLQMVLANRVVRAPGVCVCVCVCVFVCLMRACAAARRACWSVQRSPSSRPHRRRRRRQDAWSDELVKPAIDSADKQHALLVEGSAVRRAVGASAFSCCHRLPTRGAGRRRHVNHV